MIRIIIFIVWYVKAKESTWKDWDKIVTFILPSHVTCTPSSYHKVPVSVDRHKCEKPYNAFVLFQI